MLPRILGLATVWIFAALPAGFPQEGEGESFDSNGVAIHYVDRGSGTPVVLLHGFTGSYERHWERTGVTDALLKAGYRVVGMDSRGHGTSGKPLDSKQYGLEMVRDVVRLLDHLDLERVHVVGYSMGGAIANQLLVGYADRLLTVTLLGAGWEGEDLTDLESQMLALAEGFARGDASVLIRGVTAGETPPTEEQMKALNASLFARNAPEVLATVARGLPPLFQISADRLRAVKTPVLAIIGEHDHNLESVNRMAAVVPGLEVVQIPGASHATSVRPSAEPLVAFLDKHRPTPPR